MKGKDLLINGWKNRTQNDVNHTKEQLYQIRKANNSGVDDLAKEITATVVDKIDCLDCGNCCRTSVTDFTMEDVNKASKFLNISKKKFISNYLIEDVNGTYITISSPCPFLNLSDNKCTIYEARPYVCSSFPHTARKGFVKRIHAHKNNIETCPITYHVVQSMWEKLSVK